MSPLNLKKSLEMGKFGIDSAAQGCVGECGGRGDRGGVWEECWGHVS